MTSKILVVRHAPAEALASGRGSRRRDADRHLTAQGRRDMLAAARRLHRWVEEIDWIAASRLTRAQTTAALLARAYPHAERTSLDLLAPGGNPVRLSKWLSKQKLPAVTALVGHEPGLSLWIGQLLVGRLKSIVRMKKGSVCCLEVEPEGRHLAGRLLWLLTLKQLVEL